jgi:serine/threonine-protein kinase HipA
MSDLLEVSLNNTVVGKLVLAAGDRIIFTFDESYINETNRPILSQSFLSRTGDIITDVKSTHTKLPPFFSNLLPEGYMRKYLAEQGGVNPAREFKLIELLGEDRGRCFGTSLSFFISRNTAKIFSLNGNGRRLNHSNQRSRWRLDCKTTCTKLSTSP